MLAKEWLITVLIIYIIIFPTSATAALYKWQDADGRVHYSDTPPSVSQSNLALEYQHPADNRIEPPAVIAPRKKAKPRKKHRAKRRKVATVSCGKYQQKIDKIQRQLRSGYREPKGNKLRSRRRELSKKLRQCRKGG